MPGGWPRDGAGVAEKGKERRDEAEERVAAGAPELLRGLGEDTGWVAVSRGRRHLEDGYGSSSGRRELTLMQAEAKGGPEGRGQEELGSP